MAVLNELEKPQILAARGFQLDVIDDLAVAAEYGGIPRKWLKDNRRPLGGEFRHSKSKDDSKSQNT
jgi:hypothetical protein